MINSWSLLYDELYGDDEMSENDSSQQFWNDDGFSMTGNPNVSSDTITLGGDTVIGYGMRGGEGDDHINFNYNPAANTVLGLSSNDTISFTTPPTPSLDKPGVFKYNEDKSLKDARDYVMSTYSGHYTAKGSNTQTLDLIESVGDAESFCRSNALKYLSRYDKKGTAKRDILKAMHYCLLLYYFSGQTNETETRGYETF